MSFNAKENIRGMEGLMESEIVNENKILEIRFLQDGVLQQFDKELDDIEHELKKYDTSLNDSDDLEESEKTFSSSNSKSAVNSSKSNENSLSNRGKRSKNDAKYSDGQVVKIKQNNMVNIPQDFIDIENKMSKKYVSTHENNMSLESWEPVEGDPLVSELEKLDLLDDIEELKEELLEEHINLDCLPEVDEETEIATLKNIKHILLRKIRKLESNNIVEDFIFLTLKGVEGVFDGKTDVAGFKPNLKGLSKSVTLKLRNQKQQFADVVDQECNKFGIGTNSKIVAEVLISAVKRGFINKDENETDDYSEQMHTLQEMYEQREM